MVNALQVIIKTAAISGIGLFWVNFTTEAFKLAWHIVSTSPELKAVSKVMCHECKEFFIDEPDKDENHVCFTCRGF